MAVFDYKAIKPIDGPINPMRQAAKRHYGMHPYFTRRSWNVLQHYIERFTRPGDVVLDPYGGSGVTAIEAVVTERKGMYIDINPLACFIARAISAPVDIQQMSYWYGWLEQNCKAYIEGLYSKTEDEIAAMPLSWWYPTTTIPKYVDQNKAGTVDKLFTRRSLLALSCLFHHINEITDKECREQFRFVFSGVLAKVNRTFISAEGRAESRGGATIFSVYKYAIPKDPVELPVWAQFELRYDHYLKGKKEISLYCKDVKFGTPNELITGQANLFIGRGSAGKLGDTVPNESVDYIFTDPPYGAHIAYLDLSAMWNAWLGFSVTKEDQEEEVIEAGDLQKSKGQYVTQLRETIKEMFRVLKWDRWMSIVFSHKDPAYWDTIKTAAEEAGFEYVNSAVQPLNVVWSMYKKRFPLKVLSGELIMNFRKVKNPKSLAISKVGGTAVQYIKNSAEMTIVKNQGATTEQIYNDLIPALMEAGLLGEIREKFEDLTPLLGEEFDFDQTAGVWRIRQNAKIGHYIALRDRIRFYVTDYLKRCEKIGYAPTTDDLIFNVMPKLVNGHTPDDQTILDELWKIGKSTDGIHWVLDRPNQMTIFDLPAQPELEFTMPKTILNISSLEHNEIIWRLAEVATSHKLAVHIGRREQGQGWDGNDFKAVSVPELPFVKQIGSYNKSKIQQIDCIWLFNEGPVAAFEVEHSTPFKEAINRFGSLLQLFPTQMGRRLVFVTSQDRQKQMNQILTESLVVGYPLYMENKISYMWYEDFAKLYTTAMSQKYTAASLLDLVDKLTRKPKTSSR